MEEYTQLENDFVLVYENNNILSKGFHSDGKLIKSTNGIVQYFISKNSTDIENFISNNNLKEKWENENPWDFESDFRFKIKQTDLIEDDDLFQLLYYAKLDNTIKYKTYASLIIVYVNYFLQPHYNMLISKGIGIEMNVGITEITIGN